MGPEIIGQADGRAIDDRGQLAERRFAGEVDAAGRQAGHRVAGRTFAGRSDQHDGKTLAHEVTRHLGKAFGAPMLGFPDGPGCDRELGPRAGAAHAVRLQQAVDPIGRGGRDRKREIGRLLVEAEQGADAEVTIDGMHVERRHADVVRIGQPRTFAGALPGVLARLPRQGAARCPPHLGARSIESDPHGRTGRKGQRGGTELPVHVDHKVVVDCPELGGEPRRARERRPEPTRRPLCAVKFDDVGDRRMMPEQLGNGQGRQPVDARRSVAPPQFVQHRDRVDDVANRRQLDQQNSAEFLVPEQCKVEGQVHSRRQFGF